MNWKRWLEPCGYIVCGIGVISTVWIDGSQPQLDDKELILGHPVALGIAMTACFVGLGLLLLDKKYNG